jgi:hypothetical protein
MIIISGQSPAPSEKLVLPTEVVSFILVEKNNSIVSISNTDVYIDNFLAIKSGEFTPEFDGEDSLIDRDGDNVIFTISALNPFKLGSNVEVRIRTEDLDNNVYNFSYIFSVIPNNPILIDSNPKNDQIIKNPQILYFSFEDVIYDVDVSSLKILLEDNILLNNSSFNEDFCSTSLSDIIRVSDGVLVRIGLKNFLKNGKFNIKYSIKNTNSGILNGFLKFEVELTEATLPDIFPQIVYEGSQRGIERVANLGIGDSVLIKWRKPFSRSYKGETYFSIYQSESRLGIFDQNPKYIAKNSILNGNINGLRSGTMYAFAGRAFEVYSESFTTDGMTEHNNSFFIVPEKTTLTSMVSATSLILEVESTDGYPDYGILIINKTEVVRYVSKTENSFILGSGYRGLSGTQPSVFVPGDEVNLFFACQDKNSNIVTVVPTASDGYSIDRNINEVGTLVTDYSDEDQKFFQGFDFCGYHRALPQKTLQGVDDCPSYLGGEFNGFRGFNLFDRMISREEVLLDQTGEPVILLRRVWNGRTCSCANLRGQHPKLKSCKDCFGTTFEGGYDQFNYRRRIDGRVMVKFGDTTEDLKLGQQGHMQVEYEPSCWTLPAPAIRDRDLIIRFDYTNDIEYIYEVLDVTKEKLVFRHFTRQRLRLKRLDKTDIVYTYPIDYSLIRSYGEFLG